MRNLLNLLGDWFDNNGGAFILGFAAAWTLGTIALLIFAT